MAAARAARPGRLGHKSITTTVDLYGHLVPEASARARDALDKAFAGTRVCPQKCPHGCLSPAALQVRTIGDGRASL